MKMRSAETWERLLALDEPQLRASIAACERYLRSPEGAMEFELRDEVSAAGAPDGFDEAAGWPAGLRDGDVLSRRGPEKLEAAT